MAEERKKGSMQERLAKSFSRIPTEDTPRIHRIQIAEIEPNPDQPRKTIDEEALQELAQSIERHGLIQPITVKRKDDGGYNLVAGERRFRAHQLLKREDILAVVTTGNADEIAIIENIQREDLSPLEEASALARLQERHGYTQEELGRVIGKRQNTVSELLRLNTLPERVQTEYRTSDKVPKSLLLEIARLKDEAEKLALWDQAKGGTVTVRAAREQKATGQVRSARSPLTEMVATGRSFVRKMARIPAQELIANREQYEEVLRLRNAINQIIADYERADHATDPEES